MTPGLLEQCAERIAAARNTDDAELKTFYTAAARNRLTAAVERVRQLELSLSSVEKELARQAEATR